MRMDIIAIKLFGVELSGKSTEGDLRRRGSRQAASWSKGCSGEGCVGLNKGSIRHCYALCSVVVVEEGK